MNYTWRISEYHRALHRKHYKDKTITLGRCFRRKLYHKFGCMCTCHNCLCHWLRYCKTIAGIQHPSYENRYTIINRRECHYSEIDQSFPDLFLNFRSYTCICRNKILNVIDSCHAYCMSALFKLLINVVSACLCVLVCVLSWCFTIIY